MTDRRRVLIIGDNEDDREHYAAVLGEDTRIRWEIVESGGSVEGLALSAQRHFDCILLDYSLPGHSGLEVLLALRQANVTVPIIMLTGQGSERSAVAAMKYGAQDCLLKSDVASPRLQQVINDAIENRARELDVLRRANYDHLTGLMSRARFMDHLKHALAISKRHGSPFALIYADLDRFKTINDRLGHKYGDLMLTQVAGRILECTRDSDMVARLGGDEFGILLESLSDDGVADGSFLARRLAKRVCQEPYLLEDQHADIGISIGIAIHPTTAADIETLLEQADLAMYEAKRMSGTTWRIAEPRVRLKPDIT